MDPEVQAEQNLKRAHGCCCECCSIRVEMWAFVFIDCFIIAGLVKEMPPAGVPSMATALLMTRLYLSVIFTDLCMWLFVLSGKGGSRRRVLCRWISCKIPAVLTIFFIFFLYPAPRFDQLVQYVCNPDAAAHSPFANVTLTTLGGAELSVAECGFKVRAFKCVQAVCHTTIYLFSFKAARTYMRCHPDNAGLGIWGPDPATAFVPGMDEAAAAFVPLVDEKAAAQ